MKIDGVDFWNENIHTFRMWDTVVSVGPLSVRISDKIRVGETFYIQLVTDEFDYIKILQRQSNLKNECSMMVYVTDPKTNKAMYQILLIVTLHKIEVADFMEDVIELCIHYKCKSAEDKTRYDSQTIREI